MNSQIKNKINVELKKFAHSVDKRYAIDKISPLLSKSIKDFILRKGKRIRPSLFVISYLGFSKKTAAGLYQSAIAFELVHDFLLVHDDIIDKSDMRRNKPSMHTMLNGFLKRYKNVKFNGEDLAIVAGDVLHTMGIDTFLSIREDLNYKEKALTCFNNAIMLTACGEFAELLNGLKDLDKITIRDIYKIYDYKTAHYTFSSPLCCGAILAGTNANQVNKLRAFGICLGRAFQIKDDILGMFGKENSIGKSTTSDLQEAKKTLLIYYAYKHANLKVKSKMKKILSKQKVSKTDLKEIQEIIEKTGSLRHARQEIVKFLKKSQEIIVSCSMRPKYKNMLLSYLQPLLDS
ncbi:polyprenyl synthetase family protein [Thermoproteota archaeon]